MVKVILESGDIEKLIKAKYPGAEIIGDTLKEIEVTIKLEELKVEQPKAVVQVRPAQKKVGIPVNRLVATPNVMGQTRGARSLRRF